MLSILRDREFRKRVLAVGVPISLQQLITFGVNLMDSVMVGKFGEVVISAVSLSGSHNFLFSCVSLGLACGATVITSQYWGKREIEPIRRMISICLKLIAVVSLFFFLISYLAPGFILRVYTNDPAVIAEGVKYMKILAFCFLVFGFTTAATQLLRSFGQVKIPLWASVGSFFVNVFFNYVFIFGKLGAPRMEIEGAALGTLIARIFEFVVIFGYLVFVDKSVGFRLTKHLRGFDRSIFGKYMKAGLPVLISDVIMVIGLNLVNIIGGHVSAAFTAALSINSVVQNAITSAFHGFSCGSSILIGNLVGEGNYKKAYDYGRGYVALAIIVGVVGGALLFLIKQPIISIYNVSDETRLYASQLISASSFILTFFLVEHTLTKGVLRGGGDTKFLIVGDGIFAYVVGAPLGCLAAFVLHWPVWAIFLMLKSEQICKSALVLWRFFSKRWIKDVTVKGAGVKKIQL